MNEKDSHFKTIPSENVLVLTLFTLAGGLFLLAFGIESMMHGRVWHGLWLLFCALAAAANYVIYWRQRSIVACLKCAF